MFGHDKVFFPGFQAFLPEIPGDLVFEKSLKKVLEWITWAKRETKGVASSFDNLHRADIDDGLPRFPYQLGERL